MFIDEIALGEVVTVVLKDRDLKFKTHVADDHRSIVHSTHTIYCNNVKYHDTPFNPEKAKSAFDVVFYDKEAHTHYTWHNVVLQIGNNNGKSVLIIGSNEDAESIDNQRGMTRTTVDTECYVYLNDTGKACLANLHNVSPVGVGLDIKEGMLGPITADDVIHIEAGKVNMIVKLRHISPMNNGYLRYGFEIVVANNEFRTWFE